MSELKKVFLLQPLHEKEHLKVGERVSINFPFGMAYVAKFLEDGGHKVEVLDAQAEQVDIQGVCEILKKADFDILGISAFSTQYNAVKVISNFVKNNLGKKIIVVGGPLGIHSAKLTLETTPVDFCVTGEGEETIIDLLKNLDNPKDVLGIAYKNEQGIVVNPDRPYIQNLDNLPRPAYHLFPMEKYLSYNIITGGYGFKKKTKGGYIRAISLITQRGCPYRCKFCSKNFKGLRSMSPEKVIEEIKFLKETYNLQGVHLNDELFISNLDALKKFLPKIKELNLIWDCQGRVNLVNEELLRSMKDAGCVGIGYGIESGSQRLLNNMQKDTTVEQIEKAMNAARKLNLYVKVQLIFGYPGEDEQSVKETVDMFRRVKHPARRFNYITPLPGSAIYEEALQSGLIKNEAEYLTEVEVSGGAGKILVNYTHWTNEEITPVQKETERRMRLNYYKQNPRILVKLGCRKILNIIRRRLIAYK
jgi:radical SAM superfamily enzyme YgiQ (UPF0313 family)